MRRYLLVIAALAAVVASAGPANAAAESHCVVEVEAKANSGELITSLERCYWTLAEAVLDVSGGAVVVPTWFSGADLLASPRIAEDLSSSTLGIHFDGSNGSGSSITISGGSCSGGFWNTGTAWANRISSTYNGCGRLAHHDLPSKGGSSESTFGAGTTDNLGVMNNRTESVAYYSG